MNLPSNPNKQVRVFPSGNLLRKLSMPSASPQQQNGPLFNSYRLIPKYENHSVRSSALASFNPLTTMSCGCNKILVIDDNQFNILAIELILTQLDIQNYKDTDHAFDGVEGIQIMQEKLNKCCRKPYKLVLIDMNMPRMNGIQMMEKLQEMQARGEMTAYKQGVRWVLSTADGEQSADPYKGFHDTCK